MDVFSAAMVFGIIIFIGVVVIGGWLMVTVFRGIFGFVFGPPNPSPGRNSMAAQRSILKCDRPQCFTDNPSHAQFCRRCGEKLKPTQARRMA